MSRRAKLAIVALFFVLFGWLYIHTGRLPGHARRLEFELASAAQTALAEGGYSEWASVRLNGRTALLAGIAPDEVARDAAIASVKAAAPGGGVGRVLDRTDLRMIAKPYRFTARLEGEQLTLGGYAPDRATLAAIAARADRVFAGEVDSEGVEIASGAPEGIDWLNGVDFAVSQLVRLRVGSLDISDAEIVIEGEAASQAVGAEVARQLRQAPAPFAGRASITAANAPAAGGGAAKAGGARPSAAASAPVSPTTPAAQGTSVGAAAARADDVASAPAALPATPMGRAECQSRIDTLLAGDAIRFQFNDAEVFTASRPLLDAVADIARLCDHSRVRIAGHTDATGDAAFNVYLSERRAQAVKDYLISRGVDPASLVAEGFGSSKPAASNTSAAGRAINRRIEIELIEPQVVDPKVVDSPAAAPQTVEPRAVDSRAVDSRAVDSQGQIAEPNR